MDLLLDETTNDLVFINGECPVTESITQTLAQLLKVKLLTFMGEWFLDTTYGIPYFQSIFGKNRSPSQINSIIQQKILEEPLVKQITEYTSEQTSDRHYNIIFKVKDISGVETDDITITTGL